VTPDGQITTDKQGVLAQAWMSEDDRAMLADLIATVAFAEQMKNGFICDPPPTDIWYGFGLGLSGLAFQQDVTGCLTTGPPGNIAENMARIVMAY
jgi:hypothetical protein